MLDKVQAFLNEDVCNVHVAESSVSKLVVNYILIRLIIIIIMNIMASQLSRCSSCLIPVFLIWLMPTVFYA